MGNLIFCGNLRNEGVLKCVGVAALLNGIPLDSTRAVTVGAVGWCVHSEHIGQ